MERILIIAEIGECWNGELQQAKRLIEVAVDAGCDYVKFQALDRDGVADDDPEREWFLKVSPTTEQLELLRGHARDRGIGFLVTPIRRHQAEMLAALGLEDVKIASANLVDEELLKFVNGHFKRVFISTGMADLAEVDHAVRCLKAVDDLCILHCISEYPTGPLLEARGLAALRDEDVHMEMMNMLARRYPGAKIGYSDHTVGLLAPIVAAAAGARVIEKHVTLDRATPVRNYQTGGTYLGTDHVLSLEPAELAEMVRTVRTVEIMLGASEWRRSAGELTLRGFLRDRFHHDEQAAE